MRLNLFDRRSHCLLLLAVAMGVSGCQTTAGPNAHTEANDGNSGLASVVARFRPGNSSGSEQKAELQLAVARSFESEGKFEQAANVYKEVAKRGPQRALAYHRLALLYDKKGKGSKAEEYYRESLKADSDNAVVHCDLGYSLYLRKRLDDAEQSLRKAIALDPEMARAHNNLGLLLARTDREQAALEQFALAGCSEGQARANLAFALTLEERWDAAESQYRLALVADPGLAAARDGLAALQSHRPETEYVGYAAAIDHSDTAVTQAGLLSESPRNKQR